MTAIDTTNGAVVFEVCEEGVLQKDVLPDSHVGPTGEVLLVLACVACWGGTIDKYGQMHI